MNQQSLNYGLNPILGKWDGDLKIFGLKGIDDNLLRPLPIPILEVGGYTVIFESARPPLYCLHCICSGSNPRFAETER